MGLLSNRVERTEIKAGDHIYTWMAVYTYSHHGIYVGDEQVVHFTRKKEASSSGFNSWSSSSSSSSFKIPSACLFPDCGFRKPDSGVFLSCLNCFAGEGSLYKYMCGVTRYTLLANIRGGTCTTAKSDPPEAVVNRAMFLLRHGFGNYDLFGNNCEDFALYCKTGLLPIIKDQGVGRSGQALSMIAMPICAILSTPLKLLGSGPVGMVTVAAGWYCNFRLGSDLGFRKDMIKVPVEDLAAYLGGRCPREEGTKEEGSTSATLDLDIGSLASQSSVYSRAPPPPLSATSQSDTSGTTPPGMLSMQQMSTMMYEFQRELRELRELHVALPIVTRSAPSVAPPTPVALAPASSPAPPSQSETSGATPPGMLSMQQISMMMYEFQRELRELRELHVAPPTVTRSTPSVASPTPVALAPTPSPAPPLQSDTSGATPPGMLRILQVLTMMYEFQRQLRELREVLTMMYEFHVAPLVTRSAPSVAPPTPVAPASALAMAPSPAPVPAHVFPKAMQQTLTMFMTKFMRSQQH